MKTLQAANKNIILKLMKKEKPLEGCLIIPDSAQDVQPFYEVISAHKDSAFTKGNVVLCRGYGGKEFEFDGEKLFIVPEEEILALVM